MSEVFGAKVEAQRRLTFLNLGAFTANAAVACGELFGCPPGVAGVRIIGIHVASVSLGADADGTLALAGLVNDVSEAADDAIVASVDLETIILAANRWYELTLATETSERQNTLEPGDSLRFTLTNDSAAINTNPEVMVCIEWHPVPDYSDLSRIGHPSEYDA